MDPLTTPIDQLDAAAVYSLVDEERTEGFRVEFKRDLYGRSEEDKKELAADISAFANSAGGRLFIGVEESGGTATSADGVTLAQPDAELQRMTNVVRDRVSPRLPHCPMVAIKTAHEGRYFIVADVARSYAAPHAVRRNDSFRFFRRTPIGKAPLDIHEVRSAFLSSSAFPRQLDEVHFDAISVVEAGDTPVSLAGGAFTALSVTPYSSVQPDSLSLAIDHDRPYEELRLLSLNQTNYRINIDGLLAYAPPFPSFGNDACPGFAQLYRNGRLLFVDTDMLRKRHNDDHDYLPSLRFEQEVAKAVKHALGVLARKDVPPPVAIDCSLLHVRGFLLAVNRRLDFEQAPFDRDMIRLPRVVVEDLATDVYTLLRPMFDALWNAAGYPRCRNYHSEGNHVARR